MDQKEKSYFDAYSVLDVHEKMLNDVNRNEAYKEAIFTNQEYFKGKIVLDVGTGTGILSVLCAKAGAAKVYAVEASKIIVIAKSIFKENEVDDIVQLFEDKIEDVQLPEKVDIIISEWMGFYLVHEGMLDSVLIARDRFLKEDGILFPDVCELFAAPCRLPSLYSFWHDVSGVQMNSFASQLRKSYNGKPKIMQVPFDDLISEGSSIVKFALKYISPEELDTISRRFSAISKTDSRYQGLCIWFTVTFPSLIPNAKEVVLSTAPSSSTTHWEQTVTVFQDDVEVEEGSLILGNLCLKRDIINPRFYNIEVSVLNPDQEEHPVPCNCYDTRCRVIKALSEKYDERDDMEMNDVD